MAGEEGFEPSAYGFGDRRSTSWAIPLYEIRIQDTEPQLTGLVDRQGLEPRTDRLWAGCSTNWANGPFLS